MGGVDNLRLLTAELADLRGEMVGEEASLEGRMDKICDLHRESARNLVHYSGLRQHDVRDLQEELTENGLFSLEPCERMCLVLLMLYGEYSTVYKRNAYPRVCWKQL